MSRRPNFQLPFSFASILALPLISNLREIAYDIRMICYPM